MIKIIIIRRTRLKMINENEMTISSTDIEVIRTVFIIIIFYERYFKHLKDKQKHLN